MRIDFHISCEVLPKQSMRGGYGRFGSGAARGYYTAKRVKANALELASLMLPHRPPRPGEQLVGPLSALYVVRYPYRASESQKNRRDPMPKHTRPDGDNLGKQISDVLESLDFFGDDASLFDLRIVKLYDVCVDLHVVLEETDCVLGIERLER